MVPPLNQIYQREATWQAYPRVAEVEETYLQFCRAVGVEHIRTYDAGLITHFLEENRFPSAPRFLEVGARGSLLGSWLTSYAVEVDLLDNFEYWEDSGGEELWRERWGAAAPFPERLRCHNADIRELPFLPDTFSAVFALCTIEHIHEWQGRECGDERAAQEMARVLKPGGLLVISTDMTPRRTFWGGTGWQYDERGLFEHIIEPSGCQLQGEYDFAWEHGDPPGTVYTSWGPEPCTACIMFLRKPGGA